MKYPLKITTPPSDSPITVSEAKSFFREDRSIEDTLIYQFIVSATSALERHTGYHLIDTEFEMYLSSFEDVFIPKKPFKAESVSIEYIDTAEATQTLATSKYDVYDQESPAKVEFGDDLPALSNEAKYPVIITFTVGYGTNGGSVPEDWKSIISLVAMIYWERDVKGENPLSYGVIRSMLQDYMVGRFK